MTFKLQQFYGLMRGVKPDVVVGDGCKMKEGVQRIGGSCTAGSFIQASIVAYAGVYILSCLSNLLRTTEWKVLF